MSILSNAIKQTLQAIGAMVLTFAAIELYHQWKERQYLDLDHDPEWDRLLQGQKDG